MKYSVLYHGEVIGEAELTDAGIYWNISCRITQTFDMPLRIYGLHRMNSEYLGIPGKDCILQTRIPKKRLPDGAEKILASEQPNGIWKPWAGELDGVTVSSALLNTDDGISLALEPEEAIRFPNLLDSMKKTSDFRTERMLLQLDKNGNLPEIEKNLGGNNNETMDITPSPVGVPFDAVSDDSFCVRGNYGGEEQGRQIACSDI